ncbi:MAG: class II fructose-bisphosphate aldolase [Candidatus Pacebacteria bacterium]|nr:class II fructose-bisphosphate aldolase [Candidatus Paceibacterota bacterium]
MQNKTLNLFKRARSENWAIGQFNISNLETLQAIIRAGRNLESPLIIGTSEGESKFLGLRQAVALVGAWREETGLPLILNLDHGKSFDYIKEAADAGYDAIHFDGSKLSLEENVRIAQKVVQYCHKRKVMVEGEIGFIKGSSEVLKKIPEIKEEDLTDPEEAEKFVRETKVDSLAINIGTFHGMDVSGRNPHINLGRLEEIRKKIGDKAFLVLHGGSGTPEEDVKKAIKLGIVKININTELRLAYTKALKKALEDNPEETTPYKYLAQAVEAVQKVVEDKIKLFGSANKI